MQHHKRRGLNSRGISEAESKKHTPEETHLKIMKLRQFFPMPVLHLFLLDSKSIPSADSLLGSPNDLNLGSMP